MPVNDPTRPVRFEGLNTKDRAEEVGFKGFTLAENLDVTRQKRLRRRSGRTLSTSQTSTSGYVADGYGMLLTGSTGTVLKFLDSDLSLATVRSGLTAGGEIVFHRWGDRFYWSNGFETGVYERGVDRSLGIVPPDSAPVCTESAGDLQQGRILCACSFVRSDGQESGLSPLKVIETHSGGVEFSSIPQSTDSDVDYVWIYLSHPNGEVLYRALRVDNGTSAGAFRGRVEFLQVPTRTQYLDRPPPFHDIDLFGSYMLYASGDFLLYSEPFSHELIAPATGWLSFGARVTALGVVNDGFFVATTEDTWFMRGRNPAEAVPHRVAGHGAIPRTRQYVKGQLLAGEFGTDNVPIWAGTEGIVVGAENGSLVNLTEKKFSLPASVKGTSMLRQEDGQYHYVAVLQS